MKLTISERLSVMDLIPNKSNYATWSVIDEAVKLLAVTEEELKQAEVVIDPNNPGKLTIKNDFERDLGFSKWMLDQMEVKLKDMDRNYDLLKQHRSLFEKFVLERGKSKGEEK